MEQIEPNSLRLIACPSLSLEHNKIDKYVCEGETVAGHLRAIGWRPDGLHARVFIDGDYVEQAQWEYAVPRAGQALTIRVIPMGGGDNGKTALRIVAMLAIIAASVYLGGAPVFAAGGAMAGWGGVAAASISIAGTLAVSSVIPPPLPRRALPRDEHRPVAA